MQLQCDANAAIEACVRVAQEASAMSGATDPRWFIMITLNGLQLVKYIGKLAAEAFVTS